jgi:hypothetical protein
MTSSPGPIASFQTTIQLRPNVICKELQVGESRNDRTTLTVYEIAKRLAYWELLELTRENGLQYDSSLRERLTQRQRLELEKFLDPGRQQRHLWPEPSKEGFQPFPRTFSPNPFEPSCPKQTPTEKIDEKETATEPESITKNISDPKIDVRVVGRETTGHIQIDPAVREAVRTTRLHGRTPAEQKAVSAEGEKRQVIDAPLRTNQIVFAPPGTGKTYALVKRLSKLILDGEITNPSCKVLILSFSRAAVSEIVNRMDEESRNFGNIDLRYVQIRTFDSFAARSMISGENPVTLTGSYSKNIEMFSNLLVTRNLPEESLEDIGHLKLLVVDEIQDLVGERARMTLALVQQVIRNRGSVLLLGDPAQAIYDWQLGRDDDLTSAEFIRQARTMLTADGGGYQELTFDHYHRFENDRLLSFAQACRKAVGDDGSSPDMTRLRNQLNSYCPTIPESRLSEEANSTHSVAVLTRTNLEAYQLSKWCDDQAISYRVERGSSGDYWPGWIARLCMGFENSTMSKSMLERRWNKHVSDSEAAELDSALEYLETHGVYEQEQLDVEALSALIEKSQPITSWPPKHEVGLTISTVHRSKGLQFDRVALLNPEPEDFSGEDRSNDGENARVIYVAATRAKRELLNLTRNRSIFRRGLKRCSKKSRDRLNHFQLWDPPSKTTRILLDGTDEFDTSDYMNTIKSNSFKDVHDQIWNCRSLSTKLEVVACDGNWTWEINGRRICKASNELNATLVSFNSFLRFHNSKIDRLANVPVVDVATISLAWRGDGEVNRILGKPRLALIPVVYGMALVSQPRPGSDDEII